MFLNNRYLGLFIVLFLCVSCAKEVSLLSTRAGRYKCFNDFSRRCRACIPQDTAYSYVDTIVLTFKNDSLYIKDFYSMSFLTNDSFIYDRGPQDPGIYWKGKFQQDSLTIEFYESNRRSNSENFSKCKMLK